MELFKDAAFPVLVDNVSPNHTNMKMTIRHWLKDPASHMNDPTPAEVKVLTHALEILLRHYERNINVG